MIQLTFRSFSRIKTNTNFRGRMSINDRREEATEVVNSALSRVALSTIDDVVGDLSTSLEAKAQSLRLQLSNDSLSVLSELESSLNGVRIFKGDYLHVYESLQSVSQNMCVMDNHRLTVFATLQVLTNTRYRLDHCALILRELDAWDHRVDLIETVLETRDIEGIAQQLSAARVSLISLFGLPAYESYHNELCSLEEEYSTICTSGLVSALETGLIPEVKRYWVIFSHIGMTDFLQGKLLETKRQIPTFTESFFADVTSLFVERIKFCTLSEMGKEHSTALFMAMLEDLQSSVSNAIDLESCDTSQSIEQVLSMFQRSIDFCTQLSDTLGNAYSTDAIFSKCLGSFKVFTLRYPEYEMRMLTLHCAELLASQFSLLAVKELNRSIIKLCSDCLRRSSYFGFGYCTPEIGRCVSKMLFEYCEYLHIAFQNILSQSNDIPSVSAVFETKTHFETMCGSIRSLEKNTFNLFSTSAQSPTSQRCVQYFSTVTQGMPKVSEIIVDFTSINARLSEIMDVLIFKVLVVDLTEYLNGYETLPCWGGMVKHSLLTLPSFSQQPNDAISKMGDELFNLTQLLEVQLSGNIDAVMLWLRRIVEELVSLMCLKVQNLPSLSPKGSLQLSCDSKFLLGTFESLGLDFHPQLEVIHILSSISPSEIPDVCTSYKETEFYDLAQSIANLRGLSSVSSSLGVGDDIGILF